MIADWIKMSTSTTGIGTITLGSAETGFIAFGEVVADGETVMYTIEDGNNREIGVGTYTASGTTLSRDIILETLVSGTYDNTSPTAITLSGSATVSISSSAMSYLPSVGASLNAQDDSSDWVTDAFLSGSANGTSSLAANWVYWMPFYMTAPVTLSGLGARIITNASSGTDMEIGLYRMDATDRSLSLIDKTSVITTNTGTEPRNVTSNFTGGNIVLSPGMYWIAVGGDSNAVLYGRTLSSSTGHPFVPRSYYDPIIAIYNTTGYSSGLPSSFSGWNGNNVSITGSIKVLFGVKA